VITKKTYSIRPAGRHILTIGRDLIQDKHAAIVELVKNAYDADSPVVNIMFKASANLKHYWIIVEDQGHGMSRDTVINQWMVPSTDDKLKRKKSPGGRIMQGRKGVGRYAASILGDDLLLETVADKEKTTVFIEWSGFEKAQFIDDVEILIESEKKDVPSGTRLTITGRGQSRNEWIKKDTQNKTQIDKLKFELKKLISPVSTLLSELEVKDTFRIQITLDNFLEEQEEIISEYLEPYPIVDLFDYRIAG
jgi:hypothetical protein